MIGRCSACSIYGETDLVPVPNGGQRILCPSCANGSGPGALPDSKRFHVLLGRLRAGSLVPGETRDLRLALTKIAAESERRAEIAKELLAGLA